MSMILVNKNDIAIGKPLPWPLYDQEHKVLLEQGGIVRDDAHLESLLAGGACRELSWETPGDNNGGNQLSASAPAPDQASAGEPGAQFTFDDMKLKVESRLQLEPPRQLGSERILVKVIGYLRGSSLLVTAPVAANGVRLQLMEGERLSCAPSPGRTPSPLPAPWNGHASCLTNTCTCRSRMLSRAS